MRLSRETFADAAELMDRPPEFVRIPYEDASLPAYLYRADDSGEPRPTIIHHGGLDSTVEEGYFFVAAAALARGYHCLCFEGPGQGSVLREQGLVFRPDWENVVTPVVDHALSLPGVDPDSLTLMGTSLGGLLAVRAAAFEHRLAGCVAHDAVWQLGDVVGLPPFVLEWVEQGCDDFADPVMWGIAARQTFTRWLLRQTLWTFGADTPSQLLRRLTAFGLSEVIGQVRSPVLVLDAEEDLFLAGLEHAKKVYTQGSTRPRPCMCSRPTRGAGRATRVRCGCSTSGSSPGCWKHSGQNGRRPPDRRSSRGTLPGQPGPLIGGPGSWPNISRRPGALRRISPAARVRAAGFSSSLMAV
ncbi:alpha/beta hydrolase family protein [Streptomyces chartreusis]